MADDLTTTRVAVCGPMSQGVEYHVHDAGCVLDPARGRAPVRRSSRERTMTTRYWVDPDGNLQRYARAADWVVVAPSCDGWRVVSTHYASTRARDRANRLRVADGVDARYLMVRARCHETGCEARPTHVYTRDPMTWRDETTDELVLVGKVGAGYVPSCQAHATGPLRILTAAEYSAGRAAARDRVR